MAKTAKRGGTSRAKRSTAKTATATPALQLAGFVARCDPAVQRVARAARIALKAQLPGGVALVHDNGNALATGFGSTERTSDVRCSLVVSPRWVSLFFLEGRALPARTAYSSSAAVARAMWCSPGQRTSGALRAGG